MAASYFQEVYTKDHTLSPDVVLDHIMPKVSDAMNESLLDPFLDEEKSNALFQTGPLKAPNPDGFLGRFCHRNWGCLNGEIIVAVRKFFETGRMPNGVNDTSIVFIPKVQHPSLFKNFRPISLCNVIYKIVSKCMVDRLQPLLTELILENQSVFIPGKPISDNSIIAFECIVSKLLLEIILYRLDLSKAYDRVDWDFLERALLRWGFSP